MAAEDCPHGGEAKAGKGGRPTSHGRREPFHRAICSGKGDKEIMLLVERWRKDHGTNWMLDAEAKLRGVTMRFDREVDGAIAMSWPCERPSDAGAARTALNPPSLLVLLLQLQLLLLLQK